MLFKGGEYRKQIYIESGKFTKSQTIVKKELIHETSNFTFGGNTAKVSKTITVNARSGWSITPAFSSDAESNWGLFPGITFVAGEHYHTYLGLRMVMGALPIQWILKH